MILTMKIIKIKLGISVVLALVLIIAVWWLGYISRPFVDRVVAQGYCGFFPINDQHSEIRNTGSCDQLHLKAELGDPAAQYELAKQYESTGDNGRAFQWFLEAAKKGFLKAEFKVGMMYRNGLGVATSYRDALDWFEIGSNAGDVASETMLARMLEYGIGRQDLKAAITHYKNAALSGQPYAAARLSNIYGGGANVDEDNEAAVRWGILAKQNFERFKLEHPNGVYYEQF
jgi:TPR repeat protein